VWPGLEASSKCAARAFGDRAALSDSGAESCRCARTRWCRFRSTGHLWDRRYLADSVEPWGYGRELSRLGSKEFANQKLVVTMRTDAPIKDALG
jgi:hypothetical protein